MAHSFLKDPGHPHTLRLPTPAWSQREPLKWREPNNTRNTDKPKEAANWPLYCLVTEEMSGSSCCVHVSA